MKPILFSTPMVKAILAGRKTQTRRVIKTTANSIHWQPVVLKGYGGFCDEHGNMVKPKYEVGDILYVRETFKKMFYEDGSKEIFYRAQFGPEPLDWNWQPNIFMPKEAARIFLQVTDVRAERLNQITDADSIAEGIELMHENPNWWKVYSGKSHGTNSPIKSFLSLWDSINEKKCPSSSNPWVWVYTFKKIQKP